MINFYDSAALLLFVQAHGYWILFFLMVIEGPIITTIASFLSALGIFNVYAIFVLSVLGNIIGDLIWYSIGRFGRKSLIDKYFYRHRFTNKAIKKIEKSLEQNSFKALLMIKVVPPLPVPGLILTGLSKLKMKKFLFASITISFFYSLLFTVLGYYLGFAFHRFSFSYLRNVESVVILLVVIGVLIFLSNKYSKKLYEKVGRLHKD